MKAIIELKNGTTDLDGNYYAFIAGECEADENAAYFQTSYGLLIVNRADVGIALVLPLEGDLAAACDGKDLVWLVN